MTGPEEGWQSCSRFYLLVVAFDRGTSFYVTAYRFAQQSSA